MFMILKYSLLKGSSAQQPRQQGKLFSIVQYRK